MRSSFLTIATSFSLALFLAGCGGDDAASSEEPADTGAPIDSATADTGSTDTAKPDTTPDASPGDATDASDTATSDAGDSAVSDATDSATSDSGVDARDATAADADATPDAPADTAGGCTSNGMCASDEMCDALTCGGAGTCVKKPGIGVLCKLDPDGACGCDGTDYSSACAAHKAGVRVAHEGACSATGCSATTDCASLGTGYLCSFGVGNCLYAGFCKAESFCPGVLTAYCTCAGTNVSTNTCLADRSGDRLLHSGACP
jgi:hypothetical protein